MFERTVAYAEAAVSCYLEYCTDVKMRPISVLKRRYRAGHARVRRARACFVTDLQGDHQLSKFISGVRVVPHAPVKQDQFKRFRFNESLH